MRTQRHQVRRQIIDITVPDRDLGIRLHEELSGIQRRGLETLIDRCCTEMSTPDRVHRLGRVEVDLGRLSLDNLEQELLEKLYPLLRDALADKIREEDALAVMLGEDPATSAQIELVSLFCRTGTLPFWADVSQPRIVDETVEVLLVRHSSVLAGLVRELSREKRALERLVRQVAAERLRALFEVLVDAPIPAPMERAGEAWELLVMARGASVPAPMIWMAVLQTVCRGENRGQEAVGFFREVLGRVALGAGKAYRELIGRMHDEIGPEHGYAVRGFGRVLTVLWEELGNGEKVPGTFEKVLEKVPTTFEKVPTTFLNARPSPGFSDTGGTPNSPPRAAQTTGSPPPAPEKLGRSPQFLDETPDQKVPGTFEKVPTTFEHVHNPRESRSESEFFGAGGGAPLFEPAQRASLGGTASAEKSGSDRGMPLEKVPTTFEHVHNPHELRSDAEFLGVGGGAPLFEPAQRASLGGTTDAKKSASGRGIQLEQWLAPSEVGTTSPKRFEPVGDGGTTTQKRFEPVGDGGTTTQKRFEPVGDSKTTSQKRFEPLGDSRTSSPKRFEPVGDSKTTSQKRFEPPARVTKPTHTDPDEVYLDTSGLVLLWPFLATFFDRLELLLENRSFHSPEARCRAVHLLQHLATNDLDPPEYRLPLAKVLCGMPLDDVFDPGPELTPIEITECDDVLTALLAHAKNLGELTPQDFRDAFLLRRGILCTRDDSWLLRVERAPYDLALDRLPWSLRWIRLPWMQAPIAVEWLR